MGQPFARAKAMFSLIALAMASANQTAAMAQIGPYVSQGKGGNHRPPSRHCVAHDQRAARKSRNVQRHRKACK